MIYTITFSPSIDYLFNLDKVNTDGLNRIKDFHLYPGGKGLNASYILNGIGIKNQAIIFSGNETQVLLEELMKKNKIKNFINIPVKQTTRINVKCFAKDQCMEINGPGNLIDKKTFNQLKTQLKDLNNKDTVFIMGKCDESILLDLIKFIKSKKAQFLVDIDSKILLEVIKYNPVVIKPNIHELSSIFNKELKTKEEVFEKMLFLQEQGAKNVIVSCGADGSYVLIEDSKLYEVKQKKTKDVKSPIGSGDTLISSFFAYKYLLNDKNVDAIKKATAWSIATACSWFLASKDDYLNYLDLISVKEVK